MLVYKLQGDSINLTVSAAVDSLEDVAPIVVSAPPFEAQFFKELMARQYGSNSRFLKEKDTGLSFVIAMNALRRQGWPIQLIEGVAIADSDFRFEGDVIDSGAIARELERRSDAKPSTIRTDDDTPIKRAINWNGHQIGLQYQPLDERHGKILPLGYGEFLGMESDHDGMNADVYVGPDLNSDRVFAITQLDYDTGAFDEVKFIIGVDRPIDEVANLYKTIMTPEHFGGVEEIDKDAIGSYQPKTWVRRSAMGQVPPEGNQDAEPVKVEGELLSEQDWEAIADVSNADAEAALKQWKKTAPEQFAEILDAGEGG